MEKPYVIVFGNEKGGTGKSTVCMHVAMYLLVNGFTVGSIDTDARQGTLTHYVNNRLNSIKAGKVNTATPKHFPIYKSNNSDPNIAQKEEEKAFLSAIQQLGDYNFIVIDTPGNDTFLSRLAHSYADTIITPLNDSFVDLDMLVQINGDNLSPSVYSEMVWEQRKNRMMREKRSIDWIVMRNRLTNIYSHNQQEVEKVLSALSKRIGFRLAKGFSERVIFRELFTSGLTLLDLEALGKELTVSHITARQELHDLINMINAQSLRK